LPEGSTFKSVEHFGTSAWTITGRVVATDAGGDETSYFLKVFELANYQNETNV
jgi:protein-ribulosamine 3-kinase